MSGYAAIKARARQAVHDRSAVPVLYSDAIQTAPVAFQARWHSSRPLSVFGNLESTGYSQVVEADDSVVFDQAAVAASGVVLRRGGLVTFTDYNLTFVLQHQGPSDGPVNLRWFVVRDGLE